MRALNSLPRFPLLLPMRLTLQGNIMASETASYPLADPQAPTQLSQQPLQVHHPPPQWDVKTVTYYRVQPADPDFSLQSMSTKNGIDASVPNSMQSHERLLPESGSATGRTEKIGNRNVRVAW